MKKLIWLILALASVSLPGQKMFIYPKVSVAPVGTYQTVTALVTGVNDKTVTWTASGGKMVGTNPCVVNEPCTIALFSATPGKFELKVSSNAKAAPALTSEITFTSSPTPVITHPRLMITAAMLPQLRTKATSRNMIYASLQERANATLQRDSTIWKWSCRGGSGEPSSDQSQSYKEQDANLFALMSEIAPSKQERDQWGCAGRDVFMTMAGYVLKGSLDVSKGNHWSDSALALSVTPDWLLGGGYFSAADASVIRKYLAKLAFEQINDVYNGTLAVIGSYNSPAQFDEKNEWSITGMRAMGNNYTQSRVLILTSAALTFNDDPNDDPALNNTCRATRYQVCPDGTAGSLHAYWRYVTGGLLYKDWANMDDPAVVQQAYVAAFKNMPSEPLCNTPWHKPIGCLGSGRGGESNEGTSYGSSLVRLRWALNAIHTAGYDDPLLYGPQMSISNMSYWDLRYVADLTSLTGLSGVAHSKAEWNFITHGDTLTYYTYPSNFGAEAATLSADAYVGRTDRREPLEWLLFNSAFGAAYGHPGACTRYCGLANEIGNDYGATLAFDLFVALPADTTLKRDAASDARTGLPTDWYDGGNQHLVVHDRGWTTDANTIFSFYCTNTQIDHEHQFCGGFDLYSQGEYITKGRMEFNDYNDEFSVARNKNSLALSQYPGQTWCRSDPWCSFNQAATDGGQFWHGYQAGLVPLYHSEMPGYVAVVANMTNAYNGGWGEYGKFNGITSASRSLLYLRGSNQVVYYDRGASGANAWEKATYLVATGAPDFGQSAATWLTRSGKQKVYWTALEPAGATPRLDAVYSDADAKDDWEIYGRLQVDAGKVKGARFLSVLQWGPAASVPLKPSLVRSSSGSSFEGALVGSSLVLFMQNWPGDFAGVRYPASGAKTQYISDLAPNTTYSIAGAGAPTNGTADNAGILTFASDGTGDISIGVTGKSSVKKSPVHYPVVQRR